MTENTAAGRKYGYVRVSSRGQNEDRQMIAMKQEGIEGKNIFIDKQSGKDFDRPAYRRMLRRLKENDLLVVKSIDRLGRDYEEIIRQWRHITKEIKADIKVLDMPLLDTTRSKDLLGNFIADLVLQVLSYAAENERENIRQNIRQRQKEGIEAARARGVRFGRPPAVESDEVRQAVQLYKQKKIPLDEAVLMSGIGRTTFYKFMKSERA